jgi:hypothetical protein
MKIDDDHMYHGSALTQIAEHPDFKAINAFDDGDLDARGAFLINANISVYIKHATKPNAPHGEYVFTFNKKNLEELEILKEKGLKVFVLFVCIKAREICGLTLEELEQHINRRKTAKNGQNEPQYTLLVTAQTNKAFRVYVNAPGQRNKSMKQQIVRRNAFPSMIFD